MQYYSLNKCIIHSNSISQNANDFDKKLKTINNLNFSGVESQGFLEKYYLKGGDFFKNLWLGLDVRGRENKFVFRIQLDYTKNYIVMGKIECGTRQ